MSRLTIPLSHNVTGAGFFLFRPNSLGVFHYICIDENLAKIKEESAVSGHDRLKGIILICRLKGVSFPLHRKEEDPPPAPPYRAGSE